MDYKYLYHKAEAMKLVLLILIAIVLCSCESDVVKIKSLSPMPEQHWDSELVQFIDLFKEEAAARDCKLYPIDLRVVKRVEWNSVHYKTYSMEGYNGMCADLEWEKRILKYEVESDDWHEIWIVNHIKDWEELRELMFHELGHCYLLKKHTSDKNDIMYPLLGDAETDWEERMDDLFQNCAPEIENGIGQFE